MSVILPRITPPLPPPPVVPGEPFDPVRFAQSAVYESWLNDRIDEVTTRRITALEEALVSRRARRRLRRAIRESVAAHSWAAPGFYGRRLEAVALGQLAGNSDSVAGGGA